MSSARSEEVLSGIYNGNPSVELETLENWLGRNPAVVVVYVNALGDRAWIETLVEEHMTAIWKRGHIPMLVWQPLVSPQGSTPEDIERRIADGAFEDYIVTWATKLESWVLGRDANGSSKRRLYFLPAPEMNGDWHPWSAADADSGRGMTNELGYPEDYANMWKRVYKTVMNTAMDETTIQWVWTVNADQKGGVQTERYYPGDEYVDWVGINGFNYGDINPDSQWWTPEERFGTMIKRMKKLADKPLCFPEVSTTSHVNGAFRPRRKAEWIERLFAFARETDVKMVCWYNFGDTGRWESDWAVFGGTNGSSTFRIGGNRYRVYSSYRREIRKPSTRNARPDHPRVVTDGEFAGQF